MINPSDVDSSQLSRWINGESDFASDVELLGEREFADAQQDIKAGKKIRGANAPDYDVESAMVESTGFRTRELLTQTDKIFQNLDRPLREKTIPNVHLTFVEKELFKAIRYENPTRVRDLGASN